MQKRFTNNMFICAFCYIEHHNKEKLTSSFADKNELFTFDTVEL